MRLHAAARPRRLISLTPLIDVVFLLLVFFMLTASFLQPGAVSLATGLGSAANENSKVLLLEADQDGRLSFEGRTVTPQSLAPRFAGDASVRLVSHRDLPLQRLLDLAAALEAAGARELSLEPAP
ncbi:MAG: biopolymer transporter ExbD [Rhodovibrionaceae bacterium]